MYMRRIEHLVGPGGLDEYEAWSKRFGEDRKNAKGFLGQSLLQSYSVPNKYTTVVRWEDLDSAETYSRSDRMRAFLKANQLAGIQTLRPPAAFENVFQVDADGLEPSAPMEAETLGDLELHMGNASIPAVESRMKAIGEAYKNHAHGFGSLRVRRSMGNPLMYLMIAIFADREAAAAALTNPDVGQSMKGSPGLSELAGQGPALEHQRVIYRILG